MDRKTEMPTRGIVAADPLAPDPNLRRGLNRMLGLEGVGFFARTQKMVFTSNPRRFNR